MLIYIVLKHWDILKAFRIFQLLPLSEKYYFEHCKQNQPLFIDVLFDWFYFNCGIKFSEKINKQEKEKHTIYNIYYIFKNIGTYCI